MKYKMLLFGCVLSAAVMSVQAQDAQILTPTPEPTPTGTCVPCMVEITIDSITVHDDTGACSDGDNIPDAGEYVRFEIEGHTMDMCCWGPPDWQVTSSTEYEHLIYLYSELVTPPESFNFVLNHYYWIDQTAQCLDQADLVFDGWAEDQGIEVTCQKILPLVFEVDGSPGNYVCDDTPCECIHHGDVDFNNIITSNDAAKAFAFALGMISPTFLEACAADCNNNGSITAGDALEIFKAALGMGECAEPISPA